MALFQVAVLKATPCRRHWQESGSVALEQPVGEDPRRRRDQGGVAGLAAVASGRLY